MPLRYELADGAEGWPADKLALVSGAMDEALGHYNDVSGGAFERTFAVHYVPGLPTADASISGTIRFGGQCGCRVAMHEVAHALGVGTDPRWRSMVSSGSWVGPRGKEVLAEFDGSGAELHADALHFWPYGLNYETEWRSEVDGRRHVSMVMALLEDLDTCGRDTSEGLSNLEAVPFLAESSWPGVVEVHRFHKGEMVFYCHQDWYGFASMASWGWRASGAAFHAWPTRPDEQGALEVNVFRKGEMAFLCHDAWDGYGSMAGWGWRRDEHCPVAFCAFAPGAVAVSALPTADVLELRKGELACYVRSDRFDELGAWEMMGWTHTRVAFCVPA